MKKLFWLWSVLFVASMVLTACGGAQEQPTVVPTEALAPTVQLPTAVPVEEPTLAPTEELPVATPEATPIPLDPDAAGPKSWTCPAGDQKVSLWHGWQEADLIAIQKVFEAYMAACPNVTVELVQKTDLSNALTAAVPGSEGPDIYAWVNSQIGRLADAQNIIPLTSLIDADQFRSTFTATAVDAVTYKGEIYAYPESMEVITMIYNRDLISEDELPRTTDELLKLAGNWDKSDYLFVYNARNDAYFSAPWWQASGVTIIDEEGNTTFGSEQGYTVGQFIKALRDNNVIPEEIDYSIADGLFRGGQAAIIVNGPWYIQDLDSAGINYGLALLPVFSASNTPGMPFVDVMTFMLTRNAEERGTAAAAVNILQYYTSLEAQVYLATTNQTVPANQAAADSANVKALPVVAAFSAQAANGKPMPLTPFMSALWDPMAKGSECIWTGGAVEDCVDRIQTMAEENIASMP